MKKTSLVVALPALAIAGLLLSGCGMFRSTKAWETAKQESPLEIPPGLDTPSASEALVIPPPGANQPTANGATSRFGANGGTITDGFVLNDTVDNAYRRVGEALEGGTLRQYVTDFPFDYLLNRPNVLTIPHLGASTPESEYNCAVMAAKQLRAYLEDGTIQNSVNFPECSMPRSGAFRLAVLHCNIAGMVGAIASALAAEKLNIANMINKSRGGFAYTLIDLDDEPAERCVELISQIEGVLKVRKL